MLPRYRATATRTSSPSSRPRKRGLTRNRRASRPTLRRPRTPGAAVTGPSRASPLESQANLPDLDLVAEGDRGEAVDRAAVDEGPVRGAEIFHVPGAAAVGQRGVGDRDELVLDDDRVVDVAPERGDRIEREGDARGRLAAG